MKLRIKFPTFLLVCFTGVILIVYLFSIYQISEHRLIGRIVTMESNWGSHNYHITVFSENKLYEIYVESESMINELKSFKAKFIEFSFNEYLSGFIWKSRYKLTAFNSIESGRIRRTKALEKVDRTLVCSLLYQINNNSELKTKVFKFLKSKYEVEHILKKCE